MIGNQVVPDPISLKGGWKKEDEDGLTKWPSLYFSDISEYLKSKTSSDAYEAFNEYKESKAY